MEGMKSGVIEKLFWFSGWAYDFTKVATIFLAVGLITHYFFFSLLVVRGKSMEPNYIDGELLGINKLTYHLQAPNRGDVIAMFFPGETDKRFIKRVVGLPNETIKIRSGELFINNQLLPEKYLSDQVITLPDIERSLVDGEYFVLGDNRSASSDSRAWGVVPESFIIGRVTTPIAELPGASN